MTDAILLTGGNGHLGNIILATLLARTEYNVILLLREKHSREKIIQQVQQHLAYLPEVREDDLDLERISIIPLPPVDEIERLYSDLKGLRVKEIVHCAGSVEYFNKAVLHEINVVFTKKLVELSRALSVERFIHLSTAFAGGYCYQTIKEAPLPDPSSDPTDYTLTKRLGEYQVIEGGIPFLIIRPSIVIGDSRTGHYPGKPYGIYQVIRAGESFLTQNYIESLHLLAPKYPLPLLHQDAFQEGFFAAFQHSLPNSFVNLVSEQDTLPTTRDLWRFWVENLLKPRQVVYYDRKEQIEFDKLTLQEKAVIEFSSINFEIASNPWIFQRDALRSLQEKGCPFVDATPRTLDVCQNRFLKDSEKLQKYLQVFYERFPRERVVVEK